jgi:hypothetical protein
VPDLPERLTPAQRSRVESALRNACLDAMLAERTRIVKYLRREAERLKGKAWFRPQLDLEALAEHIEKRTP